MTKYIKNMNNPKISIIVPVYNVEKYLPQCMDSLLNQTLEDMEIILVDDESPDNCPAMCDEYARQDHRVKVVHKKNGGLGFARNSGLEVAVGEYIAFVDSDDYIELNTYQKSYSVAIDTNADVIYFSYQRFNDKGDIGEGEITIKKETNYQSKENIRGLMLDMVSSRPKAKFDRGFQCSSCFGLYRHDVIKRHGLRFKSERELIYEDMLFNLDYLLHATSIVLIPDVFYNYRVNPSSLCQTLRADRVEKEMYFYHYLKEWLATNEFGHEGYLRATRNFIGVCRASIRKYIQSQVPKHEKKKWLKIIQDNEIWNEIATSYPYRKLPLKYALHFYLLHKGFSRLLYYYSKL